MRPAVKLRPLTTEEETEIRQLAGSRKESFRLVQRAKVIVAILETPNSMPPMQASELVSVEPNRE